MTDVQPKTMTESQNPASNAAAGNAAAPSRRAVLVGTGALGATSLLAACGTEPVVPTPAGSAPIAPSEAGDAAGGAATGTALAAVADVPSGGGVIKGDYVITQPSEGTFKAFSKVCTHERCAVSKVSSAGIHCTCHNSLFSIEDGSVKGGPAKDPLAAIEVKVDGDDIVAA